MAVISGTDNSPLAGVMIYVEGTTAGTITNGDGSYTFTIPAKSKYVTFSYVGFDTKKLHVEDTELMLENMFLGFPPGNYDRILDFSTAVTGTLFYCPTVDFLEDQPASPSLTGDPAAIDPSPATPDGPKWQLGNLPFAPRLLTLLGAEHHIVRGRNEGHWRTSRPAWTQKQAHQDGSSGRTRVPP